MIVFFLQLISVRGGHFDYSPRAPKYLATPLDMIRDFVWILHDVHTEAVYLLPDVLITLSRR